jgi:2-dehydropantoate 2-reductase
MLNKQRIAIIGSGAVGGYYGGRLAEAGHDVRFLVRRDYEDIRISGLSVTSVDGDFKLERPHVFRHSEEIGKVDWVICALKATSIDDARRLVEPCVGTDTRILVLMNGLGLEDDFAGWFGPLRIFGGLAFTCINRGKPGHINHYAYGQVTIGHYQDRQEELEKATRLWEGSKTDIVTSPCLLRARWEKLCWNIPFSGLCVAAGGITTDVILNNPGLSDAAKLLMREVISVGNADLEKHAEKTRIDGPSMVDRMFQRTSTMGAYRPSTMIDYVENRAMEIEAIFGEPLRRAISLNIDVPSLTLLTALLRSLNRGR